MRKIVSKFVLAAGISLAMVLTFSCSSDGSTESTYWYSAYGVTNSYVCAELDAKLDELRSNPQNEPNNPTFNEIKETWLEWRASGYGKTIISQEVSETKLRNGMLESGRTPSETNEYLNELNKRGNIMFWVFGNSQYCHIFEYWEKM
jgi:hypothetical protein